ncbi:MAG: sulfatase-like hydrolase/transferase [Massilibacteroides sp.]|nr:sulfatase-like hydrolase/transferase [Massilibacteroides sp.]MDD3061296.1 sulfatase-like hydrolase/transferase [Massilibacteroides sp.]MDD4659793.1 sulfatase-like hydrolase/transferase [Massilibacteroides sp.]
MKKNVFIILLALSVCLIAQAQQIPVKRVVLFMIDGFSWEAPTKANMKVFNSLIKEGTYVQKSYVILPHHPTVGDYSLYNSCSFPNPVLHQGTLFLSPKNKMIQELFSPKQQTALIVNTVDYRTIGRGFSTAVLDDTFSDEDVVDCAIRVLQDQQPVFMRVHLQRTGQRGYAISQSTSDIPYCRNIFYPNSPYIQCIDSADVQLGRFIDFLKKSKMFDDTVVIITSDHGQSKIGWHPLFDEDSWCTPILFLGAGIAKGRELPYFEQTDIAPTIAGLLGKIGPSDNGAAGVFVKSMLKSEDPASFHSPRYLKRLNEQIKEYNFLRAEMILRSKTNSYYGNVVALLENRTFNEPFYHQDRVTDWYKAGTIKHMIEVNEQMLEKMRNILSGNLN